MPLTKTPVRAHTASSMHWQRMGSWLVRGSAVLSGLFRCLQSFDAFFRVCTESWIDNYEEHQGVDGLMKDRSRRHNVTFSLLGFVTRECFRYISNFVMTFWRCFVTSGSILIRILERHRASLFGIALLACCRKAVASKTRLNERKYVHRR